MASLRCGCSGRRFSAEKRSEESYRFVAKWGTKNLLGLSVHRSKRTDARMQAVPEAPPKVSSSLIAAILICAATFLRELKLETTIRVEDILDATGVSKSRAYELKNDLLDLLPTIVRPRGRPPAPAAEVSPVPERLQIAQSVIDFVYANPGCAHGGSKRRRYSDTFRRFMIDLRAKHSDVDPAGFADAVRISAETLETWFRAPPPAAASADPPASEFDEPDSSDEPQRRSIELVLQVWKSWRGDFSDFCDHLRDQWRISFGRTLIGNILAAYGLRTPKRRPKRSPDEIASRGSFETFFPGAQWVGDGSAVDVTIDDERFTVNLELNVDAHTTAVVGLASTLEEDESAVLDALHSGIDTTGAMPLALLLDNKPSNHTETIDRALGEDTLRIRATLFRPQNKAHCEGAFGLFKAELPPIAVTTESKSELARQLVEGLATAWARGLNHRPRRDRNGLSRVALYDAPVSEQQINDARAALKERCRKQELARATRLARMDPLVRNMLDEAFIRLELADPDHHIKSAIARYPAEAIIDGVAIFTSKRNAGTLPDDADGRYLLGIVRNVANKRELIALSTAIVEERLRWRDRELQSLRVEIDVLKHEHADHRSLISALALRALSSNRIIDEIVFVDELKKTFLGLPQPSLRPELDHLARVLAASFRTPPDRRQHIILALASVAWPVGQLSS